jgi:hypothetical protein
LSGSPVDAQGTEPAEWHFPREKATLHDLKTQR